MGEDNINKIELRLLVIGDILNFLRYIPGSFNKLRNYKNIWSNCKGAQ